jgi:YfiH family protein
LDAELWFKPPGGAHVLFTSRAHGNLSTLTGDRHEHGREARDMLCNELGLDWLCASRQVHGTFVQRVSTVAGSGGEAVAIDADGHAAALTGVGAMVLTADCLPVALGGDGAVAMLHAGWRGLAAGVLEEGIRALRELGASGPIEAVIGPGAGVCCYEVGPEVHAAFGQDRPGAPYRDGKNIDLRGIARERLLAAGVARVLDADACTICDERFFSHRREGVRAGRQGGIAWLG